MSQILQIPTAMQTSSARPPKAPITAWKGSVLHTWKLPLFPANSGYPSWGVEDAVIDQQTGFLSAPGDINELKNYLQRLIEDKELRKKMGAEGRKWSQKHSWQKLVKELYQNY